jgi:hypothetical protein
MQNIDKDFDKSVRYFRTTTKADHQGTHQSGRSRGDQRPATQFWEECEVGSRCFWRSVGVQEDIDEEISAEEPEVESLEERFRRLGVFTEVTADRRRWRRIQTGDRSKRAEAIERIRKEQKAAFREGELKEEEDGGFRMVTARRTESGSTAGAEAPIETATEEDEIGDNSGAVRSRQPLSTRWSKQ